MVEAAQELEFWQLLVIGVMLGVQRLTERPDIVVGVNDGPGVDQLLAFGLGQSTQDGV